MHGGLKLIRPEKKGFQPVYDMIGNADSKLDVLTYSSLKGFLFTLDVPEDVSEYVDLDKKFNVPVLNYILKIAVIHIETDVALPECNGYQKATESVESYFQEAKMQQTCWLKSIAGGRPAICPSVANFSLFRNDQSKNLLNFLKMKHRQQGRPIAILSLLLDYLEDVCNEPFIKLGVIVMPRVNNSITFYDFINRRTTDDEKIQAYAMVIAQIVRLFLQIKVIHFDLHSYNVLVSCCNDELVETTLIDFGNAADLQNTTDWLTEVDRIALLEFTKIWENHFLEIGLNGDPTEESHYIDQILKYIANVDFQTNKWKYGNRIHGPVMRWYERYKDVPIVDKPPILEQAYEMLIGMMIVDIQRRGIQRGTISGYVNEGNFVNFGKPIPEYFVEIPSTLPSALLPNCDRRTGECAIMGGRRLKSKRTKRMTRKRK